MKARYLTIALLLFGFALATTSQAAPRYRDRSSTDPGNDLERISIRGKVESISGQKALVVTEKGARVTVHLGPQSYWREKGYNLRRGVDVTVDGWGEIDDEDGGYCYAGEISGDGFFFDLSDSQGYPRWADENDYYDGWQPSLDFYIGYYGWSPTWSWYGQPPRFWRHWYYRPHYRYWGPRYGWHHGPYYGPHGGWRHGGHYDNAPHGRGNDSPHDRGNGGQHGGGNDGHRGGRR